MRLFVFLALLVSVGASAQPRLVFDAPRHDFATFDEGETVTHDFRFANAGDAPLRIAEVIAACGCTTPDWTRDPVAPGDSGLVRVAYASDGRPGRFEKTVRVVPEAGEAVTLRIVGDVVPVFVARGVRVGSFTFASVHEEPGVIDASERFQAVFRFQHTGDRPVRIQRVDVPEGVETVFSQRPIFPGDVGAVVVNVERPGALAPDGSLRLGLSVETDDEAEPVKTLRISGTVTEEGMQ